MSATRRALTAVALAFALVAGLPLAAQATTGNSVTNYWRSTGTVAVQSPSGWYTLYPGHQSDYANIQCLKPSKRAVSQWGGVYAAGVVRCFTTNNNTLILTVG